MEPLVDTPRALGAAIRERRRTLKLSQDDLALTIGVDRKVIYRLEHGNEGVQVGIAMSAARALGLDITARPRGSTGA